jgi:Domain of unknown function (DUF4352)
MSGRGPYRDKARTSAPASAAAALAIAALIAGCGHSEATPATTTPRTNPSGALGSTLPVSDSSGTKLDVTVLRVIDPASGADQYSRPASGERFVGVQLRVDNVAAAEYQNNANNETTLTLSNGDRVPADYDSIVGCENFDNGQITLAPGASKTGCVTFQVGGGSTVAAVRYGNTVFPGTTAEWRLS